MKKLIITAVFVMLTVTLAFAAEKTYQVTGPVLEVNDNAIVVQKDKDKWEIAKDKDTRITGDVKVGAKVTIKYKMKADSIEVKEAGKAKADTKKKK